MSKRYQMISGLWLAFSLIACSQRQAAPLRQAADRKAAEETASQSSADSMVNHYLVLRLQTDTIREEEVLGEWVQKLYEQTNFRPVWSSRNLLNASAQEALLLLSSAEEYGLDRESFYWNALQLLKNEMDSLPQESARYQLTAEFDVLLTRAMFRFALQLHQGKLRRDVLSSAEGNLFEVVALLQQALTSGNGASLKRTVLMAQPANREYRLLQQSLARWVRTPASPDSVTQHRAKSQRVAISLERWRSHPILDSEYILINIPAYQLQVVRHGEVIQTHRIIVGKSSAPTPTLSSQIGHFTTSPDWHVPHSIAVKEMLPRIQRHLGYLAENNLHLYNRDQQLVDPAQVDWQEVTAKNFAYSIQQSAGCDNSLGNIVFNFSNPYAVYLHDTPARSLFTKTMRALSHGCIRLEDPMRLAQLLLQRDNGARSLPEAENCVAKQVRKQFTLKRPMPIHIRYATVSYEGQELLTYPDIYGLDEPLLNAFDMMEKANQDVPLGARVRAGKE